MVWRVTFESLLSITTKPGTSPRAKKEYNGKQSIFNWAELSSQRQSPDRRCETAMSIHLLYSEKTGILRIVDGIDFDEKARVIKADLEDLPGVLDVGLIGGP